MPRNDDKENKEFAESNEPKIVTELVTAEQLTMARLENIEAKQDYLISLLSPKDKDWD